MCGHRSPRTGRTRCSRRHYCRRHYRRRFRNQRFQRHLCCRCCWCFRCCDLEPAGRSRRRRARWWRCHRGHQPAERGRSPFGHQRTFHRSCSGRQLFYFDGNGPKRPAPHHTAHPRCRPHQRYLGSAPACRRPILSNTTPPHLPFADHEKPSATHSPHADRAQTHAPTSDNRRGHHSEPAAATAARIPRQFPAPPPPPLLPPVPQPTTSTQPEPQPRHRHRQRLRPRLPRRHPPARNRTPGSGGQEADRNLLVLPVCRAFSDHGVYEEHDICGAVLCGILACRAVRSADLKHVYLGKDNFRENDG